MGTAGITCDLSNLNRFKCYTKSGSKIVYEDDGLTKTQSFIIFPNKTTLSTGECEYTIGLTGKLEDQHPWVDWTYTVPSNAIKGTTYSYTITGGPINLSNYKGAIVTGVPSKTWSWSIGNPSITIHVNITVMGYADYGGNVVFNCSIWSDNDSIASGILSSNSITLSYSVVTAAGSVGSYSTRVTSSLNLLSPGIIFKTGTVYYIDRHSVNPSSGTYNGHDWTITPITGT